MTEGSRLPRSLSLRSKLLILIGAPLAVFVVTALATLRDIPGDAALAEAADQLAKRFEILLIDAESIADAALAGTERNLPVRVPRDSPWAGRLEGYGLLQHDLTYRRWHGMPSEPDPDFNDPSVSNWRARPDGMVTRLLVRAGPDPSGRYLLASFLLDSQLDFQSFGRLLRGGVFRGIDVDAVFYDTAASPDLVLHERPPARADDTLVVLHAPDGTEFGDAVLRMTAGRLAGARLRATGRALAAGLFVLLAAALVDWRRVCGTPLGLVFTLGFLAGARGLLLLVGLPNLLLSRELGTPTVFGSPSFLGLIASPGDFLLSGLTIYAMALAVRGYGRIQDKRLMLTLTPLLALAISGLGMWLSLSLVENSRTPLLMRDTLAAGAARPVLLIGLLLVLLAAAELWALAVQLLRVRARPAPLVGGVQVGLALLVLIALHASIMQQAQDRLALERLRTELAPLTLEQEFRREFALMETMRQVADYFEDLDDHEITAFERPSRLAYYFWSTSELFFGGYKSALGLYSPAGTVVSHFSFDLPSFPVRWGDLDTELQLEAETLPGLGVDLELMHAELPIIRDGQLLGIVVGHVLDEPDNLPFLPWSKPYLAALGAQLPWQIGSDAGDPHYVLYDEFGTILLTTLPQPPAETAEFRDLAENGGLVELTAGDEPYAGVALVDHGLLHLLLTRQRGPIERLAATARLALLGLALMLTLRLLPALSRPGGLRSFIHQLRQYYYRKLLAALLVAAVVPLVMLSVFLANYIDRRGDQELSETATQFVKVAQRVLEDYTAVQREEQLEAQLDDSVLHWLRRVVGQEIHVYQNGRLRASSKRELFSSGLLPLRLDGDVRAELIEEGLPYLVRDTAIGAGDIPVAYASIRSSDPHLELVVALPLVLEQRQIDRAVGRIVDTILLATLALLGLLPLVAAPLARTVARPLRELVAATAKIAAGDYDTRLEPRTQDEVADLVGGFNKMASSLAEQRADLERRREYMARLLRHATTGVISVDPDGRLVTLNPAAESLLGAVATRLQPGAPLVETLATEPQLRPLAGVLTSPPLGQSVPREVDLERNHEPCRFRVVRVPLPDPAGGSSGHLILLDDVTELMRSNQLAAWAEMARAIAHEIKNPLTPIQLSTEHLQRVLQDRGVLPSDEIESCLSTVMKQVHSLRQIAGEFSTYAKLPVLETETVDPAALMRSAIGPYKAGNPERVRIVERYIDAGPVAVDSRVLSRALVNLIENALQAMPDGGTLTVAVAPAGEGNGEVALEVQDTGVGLTPEVKRRLFEPYFSTKSSGTGLGLAIARRAVEAHQGRIEVESGKATGTTMRVVLPSVTP